MDATAETIFLESGVPMTKATVVEGDDFKLTIHGADDYEPEPFTYTEFEPTVELRWRAVFPDFAPKLQQRWRAWAMRRRSWRC